MFSYIDPMTLLICFMQERNHSYNDIVMCLLQTDHTIHIAGLMRLDVEELSVDSIYITVWASPYLPLHMGKTENAKTMLEDHFGLQLQVTFPRILFCSLRSLLIVFAEYKIGTQH